ncbi:MAG: chorismate-binding protein, partial [Thermus sp.]
MGAWFEARLDRFAPLRVRGGALRPIRYALPVASAQVKSAVLLAGLVAEGRTAVIEPQASRDHTERLLRAMGVPVETAGLEISVVGPAQPRAVELTVPGDLSSAAFFLVAAAARLHWAESMVNGPLPGVPGERPGGRARFEPDMGREEYLRAVERALEYIRAGDIFQVVLSLRLSSPLTVHPFALYRALRSVNPSPYMGYLDLGEVVLVSASPESLLRSDGRRVVTRPIAGTRPRGKDEEEDRRLAEELLRDEKERAEHVMLLDLSRNDIGRVSAFGTVRVLEPMHVEYYSHVMHLVSTVEGLLAEGKTPLDALASVLPMGTVSGAPKIRAMEIIEELEPHRRGPYGGSFGYLAYDGAMDVALTLRTFVIGGGWMHVQAGAGIVADSVPEREYEECWNKAKALLKAVEMAEEGL